MPHREYECLDLDQMRVAAPFRSLSPRTRKRRSSPAVRILAFAEARSLPVRRRPVTLLFLLAAAMPVAFATWLALLNNIFVEVARSAATLAACVLIVLTKESLV